MSQKPNFYSQVQFPPLPPVVPNQPPGYSSIWGRFGIDESAGYGGYGPWEYFGRLYMLTLTKYKDLGDTGFGLRYSNFNVYRSDDAGLSWTCKDPDGPHFGQVGNFNPGAGKITVLYLVELLSDGNFARYQLMDFDLATDTWGEPYGLTPTVAEWHIRIWFQSLVRSNGHTAFIFEAYAPPDFLGKFATNITEWTGTAWTEPSRIDSPALEGHGGQFRHAKMEPSSGNIHFFYAAGLTGTTVTLVHRVIRPDNSLGPLTILRDENFTFPPSNNPDPIAFYKGKVYYFCYDSTEVGTTDLGHDLHLGYIALVGTPASEPTGFITVPVSGTLSFTNATAICPVLTPDGSTMHCVYAFDNPYNPGERTPYVRQFLRSETTDGTTWSRTMFFDLWPQDARSDGSLSGLYLGSGGVDGIGMLAQCGPGGVTNTYYMVKNAGTAVAKASEGVFGNAVF